MLPRLQLMNMTSMTFILLLFMLPYFKDLLGITLLMLILMKLFLTRSLKKL